jgi:hypothetical protein
MISLPTPARPAAADSLPAEQLYVTHCLHDEGVYRQAGFTIRACSTNDLLIHRFLLEYPTYELPRGLDNGDIRPEDTPRRLARVRIPGGNSALIHSAYLQDDDRGRTNNFFSHILVRRNLGAREALAAWAAAEWVMGCPRTAGKNLPRLEGVPAGTVVADEAVTAFLQPTVAAADQDLATLTCPARLANDPKRRRGLLALTLRGCQLALQAGPASRSRFYILAEPGLTALLLYAAARFLPEAMAANLTFSTYENAHRDLRTYRQALVVGTWLADPIKGLEPEFFTTRGFALDTFAFQSSPELRGDAESAFEEWLDLAARGDWGSIDKVHQLVGSKDFSLVSFKEALQAAQVSRKLKAGQARPEDLLVLRRSALGEPVLEKHRDKVWPILRESCLIDERLCREFADTLRAHLPDLERECVEALKANPPGDWRPSWRLLGIILENDPVKLRETFQRILPEPPYPAELRLALLQELHQRGLSPLDQRLPFHGLLKNCTSADLELLTRSNLPHEWVSWALFYVLMKPELKTQAIRFLHGGDDGLVRAFCEQLNLLREEGARRAILVPLFSVTEPAGVRFLDRFLSQRWNVRGETLSWLLDQLGLFKPERADFWRHDQRLGRLLDLLRGQGGDAAPLWDRLCGQVTEDVLLPGRGGGDSLLLELAAARDRPGPPLPPSAAQAINDWVLLRDHFEKASAVTEEERQAILQACQRRALNALAVLGRYFERFVQPHGMRDEVLADFAGFFHSFYPSGTGRQDHASRLVGWLHVVAVCRDESQRAFYQQYYLNKCLPAEFRQQLVEETHQAGQLLPVVYQAEQKGEPIAPPAAAAATAPARAPAVPASADELFQLTGVRGPDASALASFLQRAPWVLCSLAGGIGAAYVAKLYQVQFQQTALLVFFLPLLLPLVETIALQSVCWSMGVSKRSLPRRELLRELGKGLLVGLLLSLVCGGLAAVLPLIWAAPMPLVLCLSGAVSAGMLSGTLVGLAMPVLLARTARGARVAAGPLTRAIANVLAVLVFLMLAVVLLSDTGKPSAGSTRPSVKKSMR